MSQTSTESDPLTNYPDELGRESLSDVANAVVDIAEHYLGFAAREYLNRQSKLHLDKPLADLERTDLDDLAQWVANTSPLIMDRDEGQKLADEIRSIKDNQRI